VTIYADGDVPRTKAVWAIEDELGMSVRDFKWVTAFERSPAHRDRNPGALSGRETQLALALSRGKAVSDIARELRIAPSTVSGHLQRIYLKLGVHSRAELIERLRRQPGIARSA
jgi:DNA-binding NarL/FixJ family response regulator